MVDNSQNDRAPIEQVVWPGGEVDRTRQRASPPATKPAQSTRPQPPPSEPIPTPSPTNGIAGKTQSSMLAQTIISTFTDRLKTEAQKRGGYLTVGDIDQLNTEFERKREALEVVFQQSFDQYIRIRERAAFDHARKFPFDRVIVNTFAKLFERDRIARDGICAVTRYVLPGFFMVLDKMIGPEAMEEFQARSRVVVERLSNGEESALDWAEIYADPEAKKICFDALVTFAPYFEDIRKRQDWFLALINNNLASDHDWELNEAGFHNLINEMFAELRGALADPAARKILEDQYSDLTCFELDRAFEQMALG